MEVANMHMEFSKKCFHNQIAFLEADPKYNVIRLSDLKALVSVQAGSYLPVFLIKADNFDLEPPLIEFADPVTGERLEDSKWPDNSPIVSGHTMYGPKFICRSGNLAYHTYLGHLTDVFDKFRNTFTIKDFLDEMVRKIQSGSLNMGTTGGIYNVRI